MLLLIKDEQVEENDLDGLAYADGQGGYSIASGSGDSALGNPQLALTRTMVCRKGMRVLVLKDQPVTISLTIILMAMQASKSILVLPVASYKPIRLHPRAMAMGVMRPSITISLVGPYRP